MGAYFAKEQIRFTSIYIDLRKYKLRKSRKYANHITQITQNSPPSLMGTPLETIEEGEQYAFVPSASDPDDDELSFSVDNLPSWADFNASNGAIEGPAQTGSYPNIMISVTDSENNIARILFNITVTAKALILVPPTLEARS